MMSTKNQNIISMSTKDRTFEPGEGWSSYSRIFQAMDKCALLGELVGTAFIQFSENDMSATDIATTFANATEPPMAYHQRFDLLFGIENAIREESLRVSKEARS